MSNPTPTREQAMAFGDRLRTIRLKNGASQEKVAEQVGISLQHLSLLENGLSDRAKGTPANPRLGVVLGLAKALKTELHFIMEPLLDTDVTEDGTEGITRFDVSTGRRIPTGSPLKKKPKAGR